MSLRLSSLSAHEDTDLRSEGRGLRTLSTFPSGLVSVDACLDGESGACSLKSWSLLFLIEGDDVALITTGEEGPELLSAPSVSSVFTLPCLPGMMLASRLGVRSGDELLFLILTTVLAPFST